MKKGELNKLKGEKKQDELATKGIWKMQTVLQDIWRIWKDKLFKEIWQLIERKGNTEKVGIVKDTGEHYRRWLKRLRLKGEKGITILSP